MGTVCERLAAVHGCKAFGEAVSAVHHPPSRCYLTGSATETFIEFLHSD